MEHIWTRTNTPAELDEFTKNTLVENLGIQFTEIGTNTLSASMPVDKRTHQPMGLLHGGASAALAETLGSMAANMAVKEGFYCVGLEINANHLRSVTSGMVYGTAKPIHLGNTTQVWDILIKNDKEQLLCISRLTMAVMKA